MNASRDADAAYARARELAHALVGDLTGARILAFACILADVRSLERATALDRARAHASDLACMLGHLPSRGDVTALASCHVEHLTEVLGGGLDLSLLSRLDRPHAIARARDIARDVARDLDRNGQRARRGRTERVAFPAAGLLAVAVRLVPAADHARYAEEFRSELDELAWSSASCWRQVRYALNQLTGTPRMRFALRSPRRRRAAS